MWEDPYNPSCPPGPPLQLTELFDHEFDNNEEINEFGRNLSPEQIDAFFNSRDSTPAISTKISTPSAFTNSTDSSCETAPSQYSFNFTPSESDYLNPSEFETDGSANSSFYSAQASISSAEFTDPLPYFPPLNPTEAHGSMDLPNFVTDDYSTAMQQLESVTCVDPAALSVHVIEDSKAQMTAQMAPIEKPFKCPLCLFCESEARDFINHWLTLLASLQA
jgi:hypothetical protein